MQPVMLLNHRLYCRSRKGGGSYKFYKIYLFITKASQNKSDKHSEMITDEILTLQSCITWLLLDVELVWCSLRCPYLHPFLTKSNNNTVTSERKLHFYILKFKTSILTSKVLKQEHTIFSPEKSK